MSQEYLQHGESYKVECIKSNKYKIFKISRNYGGGFNEASPTQLHAMGVDEVHALTNELLKTGFEVSAIVNDFPEDVNLHMHGTFSHIVFELSTECMYRDFIHKYGEVPPPPEDKDVKRDGEEED